MFPLREKLIYPWEFKEFLGYYFILEMQIIPQYYAVSHSHIQKRTLPDAVCVIWKGQ